MTGGMQTSAITSLFCPCGKATSKMLDFGDKKISIHFGKKTYWHIIQGKEIKRTFIQPKEWV